MSTDTRPAATSSPVMRLLKTKVYVPTAHPALVARARLVQRLDEGQACRLTLVTAPAGFGKTTLLCDWLRQRTTPAAWISLDAGDNDQTRFWAYVVAAVDSVRPGTAAAIHPLLQAPQPPPLETVLTDLINEIAAAPDPFVLVWDDYHTIENPAIHQALSFFLNSLPSHVRPIVVSRREPPLPLALLRARRQVAELHDHDLRFTPAETAAFLNQVMGLGLSAEEVAVLEQRTEGWAAALQLAALSLQESGDASGFITAFSGSNRYVFDYLAQEVLQRQSAPVRAFLLRSSILERMTAPLCDALTGGNSGQDMLQSLDRGSLLVVPLDQERHWYRYHSLFADFLRLQLEHEVGREGVMDLRRRAASWLEEHNYLDEAVQQGLAARDWQWVSALASRVAQEMFVRSELTTLLGWLQALPAHLVKANPRLSMIQAWTLLATARPDAVEPCLQAIEQAVGLEADVLATEGARDLTPLERNAMLEVTVLRSSLAWATFDLPLIFQLAQRSMPYLADCEEPFLFNQSADLRPIIAFNQALAFEITGQLAPASTWFGEAAEGARQRKNHHLILLALSHLARMQLLQGQLGRAEGTYRLALQWAADVTARLSPFSGIAHSGLGLILYERNDLEGARTHFQQGIALGKPWRSWEGLLPGYLGIAQLRQLQGDVPGALGCLDELAGLTEGPNAPDVAAGIRAFRAQLHLAQGHVDAALSWAEGLQWTPSAEVPVAREPDALLLARVNMLSGHTADALALLDRLAVATEAGGRHGRLIQVLALQAVALAADGRGAEDLASLRRALTLAEPEGYIRTFVDLGAPMAALLERVRSSLPGGGGPAAYAARLLGCFPGTQAGTASPAAEVSGPRFVAPASAGSLEQLSGREIQVLLLLATGASNQDIARQLTVSLNTVKTHVKNIYAKLNAGNRAQAIARARESGLI